MNLNEKITAQRKAKGLTQQELAALVKADLRTIQRIESGKSKPRAYTLKAIEKALDFQFISRKQETDPSWQSEDTAYFLKLFCLSCFSYLLIPYVHFLVPNYLLHRKKVQNPEIKKFARRVIQQQVYWVIATILVLLTVLVINFVIRNFTTGNHFISYLVPFFGMYALNIILIAGYIYKARIIAV